MSDNATVSAWDNMANGAKAHLAQQSYVDEQRKAHNKYNNYWRKKDMDALKVERKEREAQIKRDFVGDKAKLHDELNKLSSEMDKRESEIKAKYPVWNKDTMFDASTVSGQTGMTNMERAKSWAEHSAKLMEEDSDEGNRMREALGEGSTGEGSTGEGSTGEGSTGEGSTGEGSTGEGSTGEGSTGGRTDNIQRGNDRLSNNVAHDVANAIYGQDPSGRSKQLREQARMHRVQAADEQKNSQQNFQIANRDARVEADKDGIAKAAVKNAQTVNNLASGTSAGTAALNRTVEMGDPSEHRQRADQQRQEGVKNQREMWGARQTAEEEDGSANITDYKYRQARGQTAISDALSQPEDDVGTQQQQPEQDDQQPPQDDTRPPQDDTEPEPADADIGAQQLMNAALGFESTKYGPPTAEEQAEMQRIRSKYPNITTPQYGYFQGKGKTAAEAENAYYADPSFGPEKDKRAFIAELHNTRSGGKGAKYYDEKTVSDDTADADYTVPVGNIAGAIESAGTR